MQDLMKSVAAFRDARDWRKFHGLKDEALSLLIENGWLADRVPRRFAVRARIAAIAVPVADEVTGALRRTLPSPHGVGIDRTATSGV